MLRSLNSGVTGLMNHQVRMDVIGNNISNVNTTGFKGRRVTFEESFNQLMKGASRTESKAGGTNPMQVGLGVSVGSIDVMTGQGGLQNTGRVFDLAIEGSAFFGVSDGVGTYYTRNGAFQLDAQGYIILPTNGMVLQGKMANTQGVFPPGTAIGNLQIPLNQQAPAKETTEISFGRNLNADADAKGSISYTQPLLHPADLARDPATNSANDPGRDNTLLTSLYNSNGKHLGIKENDVLTISWYNQATIVSGITPTANEISIKVGRESAYPNQIWDLEDMMTLIQDSLLAGGADPGTTVRMNQDGSIGITGTGAQQIFNLQVKSSNPESDSYVNNAFNFSAHIGPAIGNYPANMTPSSGILLRPAEQFDYIDRLVDANGNKLYPGLEAGDAMDIFGSIGKTSIEAQKSNPLVFAPTAYALDATYDPRQTVPNTPYMLIYGGDPSTGNTTAGGGDYILNVNFDEDPANPGSPRPGVSTVSNDDYQPNQYLPDANGSPLVTTPGTMLDDLIAKIRNDLKLPAEYVDRDGRHMPSVHLDTPETDDGIPAGAIVIRGAKGADFAVNNLSISAKNANSNQITPSVFNTAMRITEQRKASDIGVVDVTVPIFDESGAEHVLTMTFVHTGKAGEWEWRASLAGQQEIVPGTGTGKITFGLDGTVSSFIYDSGGSQLVFDPRNGASIMRINLNVGSPGDNRGITQFESASTVNFTGQDGYGTGNLVEVSIDEFGLIEGTFSNGTARAIAQILFVDFANPGGLFDLSDSVYTTSANSGDPIWGLPNTQSSSKLRPGALESSNVDLAGEFTNMITTQRGYQANSRIITVSDSMLEELVNLKR
ncbi:MAG: flagellar hook-basal body complex protein [Fibromonadales bacterium]|nr:flagellar hook-basal body complex protein [Fibromonadales bacterium]